MANPAVPPNAEFLRKLRHFAQCASLTVEASITILVATLTGLHTGLDAVVMRNDMPAVRAGEAAGRRVAQMARNRPPRYFALIRALQIGVFDGPWIMVRGFVDHIPGAYYSTHATRAQAQARYQRALIRGHTRIIPDTVERITGVAVEMEPIEIDDDSDEDNDSIMGDDDRDDHA